MTKIKLNFETSHGQLAKQLEKTNERLASTAILLQISFHRPAPQKKHVGSQEVAEVYIAAKCTRLVNLESGVSDDFQLTVKQWDLISQQKNVFMLVRSVKKKKNYHGNIFRGPFSCKAACLSSDLSFWESLTWSHKGQDDVVVRTHKYFLFSFF